LVWVGFALSSLAIATFLALFDFGQVYASLLQVRLWVLPVAAAVFLASYAVRTWRWKLLLAPLGNFPFGVCRDVLLTGFMVNNLVPARAGELARALALWRVTGASRRGSLATVGIERLFDGMVLIAILSVIGLFFDVPSWARQLGHAMTVMLACLAGLAGWLAFHHRSLFWAIEKVLLFFLPARISRKVTTFIERFVGGTRSLRSPGLMAGVLLLTCTVWAMEVTVYTLVMRGFGIALPPWAAAIALVATNFGIAVPSGPAHVGVYEAALGGALIGLGVDKERALSYAIGMHLLLFVCITTTGLLLMWRLGLRLGDLTGRHAAKNAKAAS
jgi:uncharacterized protein (TIRG00374 family)